MSSPYIISTWDSGQPGAKWDAGLQWDVNVGPALGNVAPYLSLVTSEHRDKPKFIETLSFVLQPIVDTLAQMRTFTAKFDIDVAAGVQLDIVGQWVGQSRELQTALTGAYFAFDTLGVGFDEGAWKGPFDPTTGLFILADESYRLLLKAKVLNNKWNGTIPQAYEIWDALFEGTGFGLLIQDFGNMHMLYALTGPVPDAVTLALFTGGYFNNRPAGVQVDAYVTPSVDDTPYFGFDVENDSIAGFDVGAWGILNRPG